jgi:hypothetical protein
MTLAAFVLWTQYLNDAFDAGLLIQLLRYGLAPRYRWLFGYFLTDFLQVLVLTLLPIYSIWYGYIYFGGQGVKLLLGVAIAISLWKLALLGYPALARFGRQILIYMLLAAMSVAAVGLLLEPPPPPRRLQNPLLHSLQALEGAADSMVLVFLAAVVLFLLWFPVKVRRNAAICIGGFLFYWFQRWAVLLLLNLYPKHSTALSAAALVLSLACLVLLTLAIRPDGEIVTTVTGHRWNPSEAEHLLGQLNAINARLEQITR